MSEEKLQELKEQFEKELKSNIVNWPKLLQSKKEAIEETVASVYKDACNAQCTVSVYLEQDGKIWTAEHSGNESPISVWKGEAIHIYSVKGYDWEEAFSPEEWFSAAHLRGIVTTDEALDFLDYIYSQWANEDYEPVNMWSQFCNYCDEEEQDELLERAVDFFLDELDFMEWDVAEDAFKNVFEFQKENYQEELTKASSLAYERAEMQLYED